MRILFVRHGKSITNAAGIIGTPDTPLAEEGLEQARITGQDLRSQNVTKIVCSPFIRAQQTAEIIAGEVGLPLEEIEIIPDLHERRLGDLEGQPKDHDSAYYANNDTEHGFETQAALIARMRRALGQIRDTTSKTDGTLVVVGHGVSGLYMLQVAKGKQRLADSDPVDQLGNAEFVEVELS